MTPPPVALLLSEAELWIEGLGASMAPHLHMLQQEGMLVTRWNASLLRLICFIIGAAVLVSMVACRSGVPVLDTSAKPTQADGHDQRHRARARRHEPDREP